MPIMQGQPTPDGAASSEAKVARPMLRITQGPSAGRIYPLDRRLTLIGRWSGCDVVLPLPTVSNRHAIVERSSKGYYLCDVGSLAGTHVAGRAIAGPVRLVDGSTFRVCDFAFTFTEGIDDLDGSGSDGTISSTVAATICLIDPSPSRPTVPPEQKLRAILDISRDLGRALQADEVFDRSLDSLFRIFPQAARGTVFLRAESDGAPIPRVVRSRSGPPDSPATCQTILARVIGRREAILSRDSPADFPESRSIAYHSIRSLISAPLLNSTGQPLGAIQLDAGDGDGRFEAEDLDVLVAVAGPVGLAVENAQLHRAAVREAEHDHELHLARRVLMDLLPKGPCDPEGYETWSYYEPAKQVGGDYLGTFPLVPADAPPGVPARRWAMAVGDVAGHGMPAALFLARLSAEVRLVLQGEVQPARCLARLNQQVMGGGNDGFFVTFSLATLDSTTHQFEAAGAGHLAPIVRRAGGGPLERIGQEETGLPLAIEEGSRYQSVGTSIGPGDVVVLCTDGIYEAMDPKSNCLGLPELERVILAAPQGARAVGEAILKAAREHAGDRPQVDDMTIFCLGRPG